MASLSQKDSPLSITASIAGILTFVAAVAATIYVRLTYLRNADNEYFLVKTSLSWYKTESAFLHDLIQSADKPSHHEAKMEFEMYAFVMEQLGKLEERLLELLKEAEDSSQQGKDGIGRDWTVLPGRRSGIALSWLGVRTRALELVKQREALGSRVLFAQMSMISSRVREQEAKSNTRDEQYRDRLRKVETMVSSQHEKLDRLETLMYRIMHQDRVGVRNELEPTGDTPTNEEGLAEPDHHIQALELPAADQDDEEQMLSKPDRTKPYYSISSV